MSQTLFQSPGDDLGLYELACHAWYGRLDKRGEDAFEFGANREELLEAFRRVVEMRDIGERMAYARLQPLSLWDEAVYSLAGFSNDQSLVERVNRVWDESLGGDLLTDPFGLIGQGAERHRFIEFWHRMLALSTEASLQLTKSAAERYGGRVMIYPRLVGKRIDWKLK